MHAIIDFLKGAVARAPNAGVSGCYIAKGGSIYAYNGRIQAGVACETGAEFNVPASELEAALSRIKEISALAFDGDNLTVKGGRLKATIQCDPNEPPSFPSMPKQWLPAPESLAQALKLAVQFTGDQGWTGGIRLMGDRVTAMTNKSGIDIKLEALAIEEQILITKDCAEFIAAQGSPQEYAQDATALFCRWEDGRWLRAQLMTDKMTPVVETILEKAGRDAPCEITEDWRQAYTDISALSEGRVVLDAQGWHTQRGTANTVDIAIKTPGLPSGASSQWMKDSLDPIMACASAWNPAAYPVPALFVGPNFRGVVSGVR